jgi:hypothetical protein
VDTGCWQVECKIFNSVVVNSEGEEILPPCLA